MPPPMPLPIIDRTGIVMPTFDAVLAWYEGAYREVYGEDVVLTNDSQDGQWVAIQARAMHDAFSVAEAVYQSRGPATAQGAGLSSVVKINGIRRRVPTRSTADVRCIGQAGTVVRGGVVGDEADVHRWTVPDFTIPDLGEVVVTATCATEGAIQAPPHAINNIITVTRGWQSVDNPAAAVPGAPVETDVQLRARQSISTMIPSQSQFEGLVGAVADLAGVVEIVGFENDGHAVDARGIPGHSVSLVVDGGDAVEIATTIFRKKGGAGTYGTTSVGVVDRFGIGRTINFFRPQAVPISGVIRVRPLAGYTSDIETAIRRAACAYVSGLTFGVDAVAVGDVYVAARLGQGPSSRTYRVESIVLARDGRVPDALDVDLAFYEEPTCALVDMVVEHAT